MKVKLELLILAGLLLISIGTIYRMYPDYKDGKRVVGCTFIADSNKRPNHGVYFCLVENLTKHEQKRGQDK